MCGKHCHCWHSTATFCVQKAKHPRCVEFNLPTETTWATCPRERKMSRKRQRCHERLIYFADAYRVSIGNTFPLYVVSFLKLPPPVLAPGCYLYVVTLIRTLCPSWPFLFFKRPWCHLLYCIVQPGLKQRSRQHNWMWMSRRQNRGGVVVDGGPSTKTHSKLLNVAVLEGKKVGATPSDQSLFGSDASFQCFSRRKPKTFLHLSRSPRNKCGRKGLSKTWSLRVLMTEKRGKRGKWINSIVIVIIDYGSLPILIVAIAFMVLFLAFDDFCDNQQPQCTYPEVRRLVTFEASPFPQSKHPVGYNSRWLHRGRDGNTARCKWNLSSFFFWKRDEKGWLPYFDR